MENVADNLCCQIRADDNSSTCTFMMEKSVAFTGACANEIIPSINHLFVYKAKEGRHIRMLVNSKGAIFQLNHSQNKLNLSVISAKPRPKQDKLECDFS